MHPDIVSFARNVRLGVPRTNRIRFPFGISEVRGFYNCRCPIELMTTRRGGDGLINIIKEESGLSVVQSEVVFIHGENGDGYTAVLTYTESGGGYDCWPELRTVVQYVDLCNVKQDNRPKLEAVWKPVAYYFEAEFTFALPIQQIPIDPADFTVMGPVG